MGKFILHVSDSYYTFSFYAPGGDKIAMSLPFITRSSARQAISQTRACSERAHLYRKLEASGQYSFELYSETVQLLVVSERYRSAESRDHAIALVQCKAMHADYFETI